MTKVRAYLTLLVAAALALTSCADGRTSGFASDPANPEPGTTAFISADDSVRAPTLGGSGGIGGTSGAGGAGGMGGAAGGDGDERAVEEGDVYRSLGDSLLLNLNAFRGLQVIDLSNLASPRIVGQLKMTGTPVEAYVSGDRAYVLMNDWRAYWGSRDDVAVQAFTGGIVLSVDLGDPANPVVIDREVVPGRIVKSRRVAGDGQEALYVVSQNYGQAEVPGGGTEATLSTHVKSLGIADGRMAEVSSLDLGGWITDIAATPRALLVARHDWTAADRASRIAVIDISRPDGTMIEGDEVAVAGIVESQFNMDLRGNVLRVVSGRVWTGSGNHNHLETFDATDLQRIVPIDHETFGANEDLFATLFLDDSAFFVTYFRTDPFHAFEITPEGDATERAEFIVSGWNDFFRPVAGNTRLVGIGVNDQGGRTAAVSLYDVTDLSNPNPLVARAEVAADYSCSEASWDHRAFAVLEDVVAVQAADGTIERSLVLLPFSGWDVGSAGWSAAVQVFTFSETTLTRRGVMQHGTEVHRTFQPAPATAANLSQQELSLFDIGAPDSPLELSRLELAPNYTDVIPFGGHTVRVKQPYGWYAWYSRSAAVPPPALVEVLPADEHPDEAQALGTFVVPSGSSLYKVGTSLLAVVTFERLSTPAWNTTIRVFDLANPAQPRLRGTLATQQIQPSDYYGYYGPWGAAPPVHVVGNALAFVEREPEQQSLGTAEDCTSRPAEYGTCPGSDWADGCTVFEGGEYCRTLEGRTTCSGEFASCVYDADDGSFACTPIDRSKIELVTQCWEKEVIRYWDRFGIEVVDLSQPDTPRLTRTVDSERDEEAVSVLAAGDELWLTFKKPYVRHGDDRPYVRFFARRIRFADPASPVVGSAINLPGQLLAVDGDTVFTRDQVWGSAQIEAAVARLRLRGESAVLEAHRRFAGQEVAAIALDGAGHVVVSHRAPYGSAAEETGQQLTILNAASPRLAQLATTPVDDWATLIDARAGRTLFQVPGGLLVFNIDDPAAPWPQAYFATQGWPRNIAIDGRSIVFAAGLYGIHAFDLDESNITPAP